MQQAKDTFYEVVRARVAALNPQRTVVVRGAVRPGVVVGENELAGPEVAADCFQLSWEGVQVDVRGALPMVETMCVISYATAGTQQNAWMDRGRMLSAMDAELLAVLEKKPKTAVKSDFSALQFGGSVKAMATKIWWGDMSFGAVVSEDGRLRRTVKVPVMSYVEAGEL